MRLRTHLHYPAAFLACECREVVGEFTELFDASVCFEDPRLDDSIRKTKVVAIPDDHWLRDGMMGFCELVNKDNWQLDITENDVLQFGEYQADGHYDWHMDVDPFWSSDGMHRKVSAVLMLSDPDDYEGGEFQFQSVNLGKLGQGDVVVFPSFLMHRVTPVTSGVRRSVVCWAKGPKFR